MRNQQTKILKPLVLTVSAAALALVSLGCSAHVDGGSGPLILPPLPTTSPTTPTTPGQQGGGAVALTDGLWIQSQCQMTGASTGTKKTMLISGANVSRIEVIQFFDYPTCIRELSRTTDTSGKSVQLTGTQATIGADVFEVRSQPMSRSLHAIQSADGDFDLQAAPQTANAGPAPTSCPSFTGIWQMNSTYFHLAQEGCSRLVRNSEGVPSFFSTYREAEFFPDGRVWDRFGGRDLWTKSHFETDRFVEDYDTVTNGQTQHLTRLFYLTKQPCNLMNPSGSDYFVEEIKDRDTSASLDCEFFAKWK